ncbi:MAG TPA: CapA family protein [Candidatus Paceibacterota bacterium]|nr:CapA family protein [Candidatus Paceibacterota bacterium]HMO83250.1 CapA family protein [Candidatus Paceibacterota bacterium]
MIRRNWILVLTPFLLVEVILSYVPTVSGSVAIGSITPINSEVTMQTSPPISSNINQKIFFLGDLMLARNVERRLKQEGLVAALKNFELLWSNAYVVANFEAAVPSTHIPTPDFTFSFSVNKVLLPALREAGVTHVSLANNHAFDFGLAGYENTVLEMGTSDLISFGHPHHIATSSFSKIKVDESEITLIGLNLTSTLTNINQLKAELESHDKSSDIEIAYVHWGEEYKQKQSSAQRQVATKLSELGIDVIIGHHPHVIQGIEKINQTLVFYSLGNFLFDQYFSEEVQLGLMLALTTDADGVSFELIPVSSLESRVKPQVANETLRHKVLENISQNSDQSLREEIMQGRVFLPLALATSTEVVIMTE